MTPIPDTVPVHLGLFADSGRVHLIGGRCRECDRHHFPLATGCPYCSAVTAAIERVELPDHGTLWAWTAVTSEPPGYEGDVPFGFGVVELPVGIRVITRLTEAEPSRLRFGEPMQLVVVALHTDEQGRTVTTYAFAPTPEGARS